jgi:glycosyltransferase involved in cell wall biosynthesis
MLNKKKILCILQLAPPVHGASTINGYLINSDLINQNFNLETINLQFNKSIKKLEKFSIAKVFKALGYSFEIVKKMTGFKPDLIYYTFSTKGFSFYRDAFYLFIIKLFGSKIVLHFHSKGLKPDAQGNFIKKFLYGRILKNSSCICLSTSLKSDIERVAGSLPYIIPNGIPEFSIHVPDKIQELNPVPAILYLSNYIKSKGILILIEALGILKKQGYAFNARLVGAPADVNMEILNNLISINNLSSSVIATGPLYGENKIAEFRNADMFVFPTYYENEAFPLVILEAMQFGLPVISTFEGGIPDMIRNNVNGILVEKKNAEMLAEQMAKLLLNAPLRKSMGNSGYQTFKENYTLRHFEINMYKTFNDILGDS